MKRLNYVFGETRYIRLQIRANNDQAFQIRSASYELRTEQNVVEASGDCVIDEHMILALISPQTTGRYKAFISYEIANEFLIEVIEVVVT